MDADWLNRIGILAELVSFFLIAPEIIGRYRLRAAEVGLDLWGKRHLGTRSFWELWELPPRSLPPLPVAVERSWLFVSVVCSTALALGFVVPEFLWRTVGPPIMVHVLLVTMAVFFFGAFILEVRSDMRSRLVGSVMTLPGTLLGWLAALLGSFLYLSLIGALRSGVRLLQGEGRLRALVFGTGVLLLFGGMGAQFYATF